MINFEPLLSALLLVVTTPPTAPKNLPAYAAAKPSANTAYVAFSRVSQQRCKAARLEIEI